MKTSHSLKFYIIISLILSIIGISIFTIVSINLLKNTLYKQEIENLKRQAHAIQSYFEHFSEDLLGKTRDEAVWDDAYDFLKTKDPQFIKSNMCVSAFTDNDINLFLYLDLNKNPVAGGWFYPNNKKIILDTKANKIINYLKENLINAKPFKKFIWLNDKIVLIAAHPILKSDGSGTPRGFVVMGKVVNNGILKHILQMFNINEIHFIHKNAKNMDIKYEDNKIRMIIPNILNSEDTSIEIIHKLSIDIYSKILNLFGIQLLVVMIILCFILLLISRKFVYPIHVLTEVVGKLSKTNYDLKKLPDINLGLKEMDELYSTLKTTINEIYFLNKQLIKLNNAISLMMSISTVSELKNYTKYTLNSLCCAEDSKENGISPKTEKELKRILIKAYSSAKEQINLKNKLKELAYKDALTNLYNRTFFYEYLVVEIERAKRKNYPISILIVDLDNLKEINDTLGHSEGDMLIKNTAEILQKILRKSDIAVRYGGDEFLVLLPETDKNGAHMLKNRLKDEIAKYNKKHTNGPYISLSIGDATWYPDSSQSIRDKINEADKKMYTEKALKRFSITKI